MARTPTTLGVIASVIAIGGAVVAVYKTLESSGGREARLPENKQVIAFHQLANRICAENMHDLEEAFPAARSNIELLAFLSRATGWGTNDLLSITPPPRFTAPYVEEIHDRKRVEADLLSLQKATETGNSVEAIQTKRSLALAERRATQLRGTLGLRGCAPILPPRARGS